MAEGLVKLNDNNFDETVAEGITIVDFWAPWCGPCKMQTPILEGMVPKVGDDVTLARLNVDEAPQAAGKYGIRAIPTMLVFKDGEIAQQFVGVQQEPALMAAIESARS